MERHQKLIHLDILNTEWHLNILVVQVWLGLLLTRLLLEVVEKDTLDVVCHTRSVS